MDVSCGVEPYSEACEASQGPETLSRAEAMVSPLRVTRGARHTLRCHEQQDNSSFHIGDAQSLFWRRRQN